MGEWIIKPSYKLDLASFCNLFFQSEMGIERHKEGYEKFKDAIEARQDLIDFAKALMEQGILVGVAAATALSLVEYNGTDIDEICRLFEDKSMFSVIENYISEQGMPHEMYVQFEQTFPGVASMLRYVHGSGFLEYWQSECQLKIESMCRDYLKNSEKYPVVTEVNKILGFEKVKERSVTLYLCSFTAPYGVGLKDAFISDTRWNFQDTVAVAVHELIHPPFAREKIREITKLLWEDEFLQEGKGKLPPSSGYRLPEDFVEENLVEGTHIYLSEQLGVEEDPLKYLISHDSGSHVLSVILYDALKKGIRSRVHTIEEAVDLLISDGTLRPGNMRKKYLEIYEKAGMGDLHPFQ